MKKLLILLSAILLLVGCGSPPSSPPSQPKLTATSSPNGDGTSNVSWTSGDSNVTGVTVQDTVSGDLLYTGGPTGTTVVRAGVSSVRLVAYVGTTAVDMLIITIGLPPIPPPPAKEGDITFTISWTLPTTYEDGTLMTPEEIAAIVVEVYWKPTNETFTGAETLLATSTAGYDGVIVENFHVFYNQPYYFSVRCHVVPDGLWSGFAPPYEYTWPTP